MPFWLPCRRACWSVQIQSCSFFLCSFGVSCFEGVGCIRWALHTLKMSYFSMNLRSIHMFQPVVVFMVLLFFLTTRFFVLMRSQLDSAALAWYYAPMRIPHLLESRNQFHRSCKLLQR
jgi:hypothetical protein